MAGLPEDGNPAVAVPVTHIYTNIQQEVLYVTVDKVRLCLGSALKKLSRKERWIAPLGILITIVGTLVGATFKDAFLTASQWQLVFSLGMVCSLIWLVHDVVVAFRAPTVESVIEELKAENLDVSGG